MTSREAFVVSTPAVQGMRVQRRAKRSSDGQRCSDWKNACSSSTFFRIVSNRESVAWPRRDPSYAAEHRKRDLAVGEGKGSEGRYETEFILCEMELVRVVQDRLLVPSLVPASSAIGIYARANLIETSTPLHLVM